MIEFSTKNVSYEIYDKDKILLNSYKKERCYIYLEDRVKDECYIKLINIKCKQTFNYHYFYLVYIGEMFNLEYSIEDDNFMFYNTKSCYFNLIICTCIRFLFDEFSRNKVDRTLLFLELLKEGRCEYKDKLARFLYFYNICNFEYANNHLLGKEVNIITLDEFYEKVKEGLKGVQWTFMNNK